MVVGKGFLGCFFFLGEMVDWNWTRMWCSILSVTMRQKACRWRAIHWGWWSKTWSSWVTGGISEQLKRHQQLPTFLCLFLFDGNFFDPLFVWFSVTNPNTLFKTSSLWVHALGSKPNVFFIEEHPCPICVPDSQLSLGRKVCFTLAVPLVQTQIHRVRKRRRYWTLAGYYHFLHSPLE